MSRSHRYHSHHRKRWTLNADWHWIYGKLQIHGALLYEMSDHDLRDGRLGQNLRIGSPIPSTDIQIDFHRFTQSSSSSTISRSLSQMSAVQYTSSFNRFHTSSTPGIT